MSLAGLIVLLALIGLGVLFFIDALDDEDADG